MLGTSSKAPHILYCLIDFRKTDLKGLWSDKLIEILIPNAPELYFGHRLIHGDPQRL
jgi:hypothetical protein